MAEQYPPELLAQAQALGIDPAQLATLGAGSDPFTGSVNLPVLVSTGATPKKAPRGTGEPDYIGRRDVTKNQSDLLRDLYATADPAELLDLQRRLFEGGFYGAAEATQIRWGVLDERTTQAYQAALERAGLFYAAGRKVTLDQVIGESGRTGAGGPGDLIGGRVGGANAYTARLSDPDTLNKVADRVATEVFGRKATATERGRIVAVIQEEERAASQSVNTAAEGQSRAQFGAQLGAERAVAQTKAGGGIINPVPGAAVADTMGADRDGGKRKHKGTDIFGAKGSAAVAPIGGTVVKAGNSGGNGGLRVWIEGDDGRFHYLAHLDRIDVKQGQRIEQGTPIGTVGNTGNAASTAPHVHYSINSSPSTEDAVGNPALELGGKGASAVREVPSTYIPPVTTTVQEVDPTASAERLLREQRPAEAGAHDLSQQFSTFLDLIRSPV